MTNIVLTLFVMRRTITFLLIRLNWLTPSQSLIERFQHNNDSEILQCLLRNGSYKTRPIAAKALADIEDHTSIPLLLEAIHDNIHHVSIDALNALECLDVAKETKRIVNRKRFHWAKLFNNKSKESKKPKAKSNIYRWERASKKSFEMVKDRLKRPIR